MSFYHRNKQPMLPAFPYRLVSSLLTQMWLLHPFRSSDCMQMLTSLTTLLVPWRSGMTWCALSWIHAASHEIACILCLNQQTCHKT